MEQYSFDELVKNMIISRRTKYKYFEALEKVGIGKNHIVSDDIDIRKSESFFEYHQAVHLGNSN